MKRTRDEIDSVASKSESSNGQQQPDLGVLVEKEGKPVYLTKQQRALLAKQARIKAQEEKRAKMEQMRKEREQLVHRYQEQQMASSSSVLNQDELRDLQQDYLGTRKVKKRQVKASERHKFAFDWNEEDDTSRDLNPIYDQKLDPVVMFGRGRRAGIDTSEQDTQKSNYEELVAQRLKNDQRLMEKHLLALENMRNKRRRTDMDIGSKAKHWSEKTLAEMDSRDWRIFREDYQITVRGGRVPNPIRNWDESDLSFEIIDTLKRLKYDKPTAIQMQCIPISLQNRDLIGLAETGSGKTLAYLLPMLTYISNLPKMTKENAADGPYAVVLAPTRELAQQIESVAKEFGKELGIRAFSVVGGVSLDQQLFLMREGCEIIIGTPGRLLACLSDRYIVLNQCNYVVLDEADRMIDLNFEKELNAILEAMPSSNIRPENEDEEDHKKVYRQTTMFSATMPLELEQLASKYLRRRVVVTIGEVGAAVQRIEQQVIFVKSEQDKMNRLLTVLSDAEPPVIIFLNTKKEVDKVAKYLDKSRGFRVATIHGNKSQDQREAALEGFKSGKFEVLAATDVVGRGIDIPGVTLVVNYDLPKNISVYTHRIGRTGRAGKTGVAVSFLTDQDTEIMYDLKQMLINTKNIVPLELENHPASSQKPSSAKSSSNEAGQQKRDGRTTINNVE